MAPSHSNPPSLPPSVEEAYRRKCIQLKQRTKEIEEENDAYSLRLIRLKRQIQKSRFERAILLEQIAKRTSTNVEDSDGSPSPPPTPKDKPLRIKRGHRKQSLFPDGLGPEAGSSFISANMGRGLSPTNSEALSHVDHPHRNDTALKKLKRPSNAFEIYCNDLRPVLQAKNKEKIAAGEFRLEEELARGWKDLGEAEKKEFQSRYEEELAKWREDRDTLRRVNRDPNSRDRSRQGRDSFYSGSRAKGSSAAAARRPQDHDSEAMADDDGDQDVDDQDQDQDVEMGEAEAEGDEQRDSDPETEVEMENDAADNNADED